MTNTNLIERLRQDADFGNTAYSEEGSRIQLVNRIYLLEAAALIEQQEARIRELEYALVRITLRDRHYRVQKPKEDGGIRGPGGMIATYALMGVNGSYIGDAEILAAYPDAAKTHLEE